MPFMKTNILPLWTLLAASLFLAGCDKDSNAQPPAATNSWNLPLIHATAGVPVEYLPTGTVISDQRFDIA